MADPGAGSKYLRLARSLVAERLRERGGPENGASAASKGPENGPGAVQGAEDGSAARAPPPPGRARRKLSFRGAKGEEDCSLREAARRDQASVLSDRSNAPIPREAGDPLAAMHARAEERRKRRDAILSAKAGKGHSDSGNRRELDDRRLTARERRELEEVARWREEKRAEEERARQAAAERAQRAEAMRRLTALANLHYARQLVLGAWRKLRAYTELCQRREAQAEERGRLAALRVAFRGWARESRASARDEEAAVADFTRWRRMRAAHAALWRHWQLACLRRAMLASRALLALDSHRRERQALHALAARAHAAGLCRRALGAWSQHVRERVRERLVWEARQEQRADAFFRAALLREAWGDWVAGVAACRDERAEEEAWQRRWAKIGAWLDEMRQSGGRDARPGIASPIAASKGAQPSHGRHGGTETERGRGLTWGHGWGGGEDFKGTQGRGIGHRGAERAPAPSEARAFADVAGNDFLDALTEVPVPRVPGLAVDTARRGAGAVGVGTAGMVTATLTRGGRAVTVATLAPLTPPRVGKGTAPFLAGVAGEGGAGQRRMVAWEVAEEPPPLSPAPSTLALHDISRTVCHETPGK